MSKIPHSAKDAADSPEWVASRRAGNVRIALSLIALVVIIFGMAIWKYRPA